MYAEFSNSCAEDVRHIYPVIKVSKCNFAMVTGGALISRFQMFLKDILRHRIGILTRRSFTTSKICG